MDRLSNGLDQSSSINNFVSYNKLEYSGAYGRSLSVGNNQDAVLNSQFNLQVSGYIADSIKIEGAIADNTIPVQPEGNTQNLQEFDQVYIKLSKNQHQLQIGDYNIERPSGYFLNFYKRVQGLYYQSGLNWNKDLKQDFGISASVAKGQFARNIYEGKEGNQGPYKLTGNNGEQFFIVLANTERVYINGQLQERGESADYIINYNTAEVSFMPRRLITKDSRIQIEFEYQDRNYLNSLLYGWTNIQIGKNWKVHINAYSNQDAKNQSYTQNLNGDQKRFLGLIGDSVQNALYPVLTLDTFAANKILYKLVDTTVAGQVFDSVFVYSIHPDSARYNLNFAFVGPGRGDYNISSANANGRVYDWAPPVNGNRVGSYAPVQLLITPKQQQVFTSSISHQIDSFKSFNVEASLSNYDPNTFSTLHNGEHWGTAIRAAYQEHRSFGKKDTSSLRRWEWQADASYEYVDEKYKAIAPYRNVEFNRDWNVAYFGPKPEEHLARANFKMGNKKLGTLSYNNGFYSRGNTYTGYRNVAGYEYQSRHWLAGILGNLLTATDTQSVVRYFRPSLFATYKLQNKTGLEIGVRYDGEHNAIRGLHQDSLRPFAFAFDNSKISLRNNQQLPLRYEMNYTIRRDAAPIGDKFLLQNHSQTLDLKLGMAQWENHQISFIGSYRELKVDDTTIIKIAPENTVLSRLEYRGTLARRSIQFQSLYEIGSGQEQRRSYTYIEVPAGQGVYFWNDYNADGVQQANEFEVAQYQDQKRFIRVLTLTNEYIKVNFVNYNQSITLEPSNLFFSSPKGFWGKLLYRISDQASLQVGNRLLSNSGAKAYNPFADALQDESIITTSSSMVNTFFFNRSSAIWGLDYNYLRNTGKQLLTYGVEGQTSRLHTPKLRWNITKSLTINLIMRAGRRAYSSALDDNRTYQIHTSAYEPTLTWLYRSRLRITGSVKYDERVNQEQYGGEQAKIKSVNLDFRFTQPGTGALQVRGTFSGILYQGKPNTSVSFIMLDALQAGNNFLWFASWERRVGKGIELSLEYEGRKPGIGTTVHTGRMSLRAIL